jgi:hypothetical protein
VSTPEPTVKRARPGSIRQRVNHKILQFSLVIGAVAALLTAIVYVASAYPAVRRWKEANVRALSEINCVGAKCDTSGFVADAESGGADYVIDLQARYFINVPTPTAENPGRFAPLDYSDTAFIERFRNPASYTTPDGEVWRLHSEATNVEGKNFEIIVGHQEKAPSKMIETMPAQLGDVDAMLRRSASQIAKSLPSLNALTQGGRNAALPDGFAVVDASTRQVVKWGMWLPEFLPEGVRLPTPGWQAYIYDSDLYVLQTDTNGRVLASSVVQVGGLWWILGSCGLAFLIASLIAHLVGGRFLRQYFATETSRVPTLGEALRSGEGQSIEFKRGLSDSEDRTGAVEDEVLKSVAAFANTNDGVIYIGVDDAGHVKGLGLDFKQKDRMERKVRQLVRNRIRPTPPIQIVFEDVGGLMVARIVVARGEDPVYLLGGVIYVRYGSSDVQAQPEDLKRIVLNYAF